MLFAVEGVLCVAMAVPIAVPLAALGGLLGRSIACGPRAPRPTRGCSSWPSRPSPASKPRTSRRHSPSGAPTAACGRPPTTPTSACTGGEFRLIAPPGGRTRLEGRTWYTLDMAPGLYWRLWGDGLISRIHQRVLAHVKRLAER